MTLKVADRLIHPNTIVNLYFIVYIEKIVLSLFIQIIKKSIYENNN